MTRANADRSSSRSMRARCATSGDADDHGKPQLEADRAAAATEGVPAPRAVPLEQSLGEELPSPRIRTRPSPGLVITGSRYGAVRSSVSATGSVAICAAALGGARQPPARASPRRRGGPRRPRPGTATRADRSRATRELARRRSGWPRSPAEPVPSCGEQRGIRVGHTGPGQLLGRQPTSRLRRTAQLWLWI